MAILSRSIAQRNNNHLETTKSEKNVDSVASSVSPFSNHLLSFSRLGLESFTYHLRDREYLKLLILYYLRTRCSNEASPFIKEQTHSNIRTAAYRKAILIWRTCSNCQLLPTGIEIESATCYFR